MGRSGQEFPSYPRLLRVSRCYSAMVGSPLGEIAAASAAMTDFWLTKWLMKRPPGAQRLPPNRYWRWLYSRSGQYWVRFMSQDRSMPGFGAQ